MLSEESSEETQSAIRTETEAKNYFGPGRDAEYPFGVLYQGEWETESDGNAFAVRKHARALADAGLPVLLKSFSNVVVTDGVPEPVPTVGLSPKVREEIKGLHRTHIGTAVPMIKHMVVKNAERLTRSLMRGIVGPADRAELVIGAQQAAYKATIVYSVWERDRISPSVARHLSLVGENWVPCQHNAELLKNHGVENVVVVPHPYDPADPLCQLVRRRPHTDEWRLFYSIGKWEPRKGYHELVGAFLRAFTPADKVVLTIKYSGGHWPDYPKPAETVQFWLADEQVKKNGWTSERLDRRLVLLSARLPRSRIVELHYRNNIYVNSSHGEAWCLPAFEAKLAGNALVHVAYGGTADFSHIRDRRVPFALGAAHPTYGWEHDAQWAVYDLEQLSDALRVSAIPEVFERPQGFECFSKAAVGHQMRQRITALARGLDPKAADFYETRPNTKLALRLAGGSVAVDSWLDLCGRRIATVDKPEDGVRIPDNVRVRHGGFEAIGSILKPGLKVLEGTEIELFDVPRTVARSVVASPGAGWIREAKIEES